jgi:SpoVK/Ycf46/Vps4 family AAA+-type ATPase
MKSNIKVNLNINKDDENLNDYLYTWSELGTRPSKTSIHGFFDSEKFLKYIEDNFDKFEISNFTDIIPNDDISIINQRTFLNFQNGIFLTYTHLDKIHEQSLITDLSIFYTRPSEEKVDEIVNQISSLSIQNVDEEEDLQDTTKSDLNILDYGQNGFELEKLNDTENYENIEYFFEDSILKDTKRIIKSINKSKSGLTILCGERGCGKTTLLSYIASNSKKNKIFIPCTLIENSINNFEFRKFLKKNKNVILLLDDVELYFSKIYSKSNSYTNNLLQLVDGISAKDLDINIILSLNCSIEEIDKNLLESNSLLDIIEVGKLSENKGKELCEFLDHKSCLKGKNKIIDFLKNRVSKSTNVELGFK